MPVAPDTARSEGSPRDAVPASAVSVERHLTHAISVAALVATFIATLVLVGWYAGIPELTQLMSDVVGMQFNAAVGVVSVAIALRAEATERRRLSGVFAGVALLVGVVTLVEYVGHVSLGIDGMAWGFGVNKVAMARVAEARLPVSGRMAPSSALSLVLLGAALLFLATRRALRALVVTGLVAALAATTLGAVELLGYLIDVPTGSGTGHQTRMALPTALSMIALGLGVLTATLRYGLRAGLSMRRWVPLFGGVAMAGGTVLLWRAMVDREHTSAHHEVVEVARALERELKGQLDDRVHLLSRLANGGGSTTSIERPAWAGVASELTRDYSGLVAFGIADSASVLRWISATGGEPPFAQVGQRLDADASLAATLRAARNRRAVQASPPLAHGSAPATVLLVVPFVIGRRTTGYLIGHLSPQRLANDVLDDELTRGYSFVLHEGSTPLAVRRRVHSADATHWSASIPVDSTFGRRWTLTAVPTNEILAGEYSSLPTVFLAGGLLCAVLLGSIIYSAQQSREKSLVLARTVHELAEENDARRAAEEMRDAHAGALARAQDFRIALVRSTEDAVAAFDAAGCVSEWNPAMEALTGSRGAAVEGQVIGDLLPFLREGEEVQLLLEALAGRRTQLGDVYTKTPSGDEVWLDVTVTPMLDEGRPIGGLLVARDVTGHKRVADVVLAGKLAAEEASRAKSAFLARMSHELRTPLNAIIGFTNVLRRNRHGRLEPVELTYLERINANGRHLLAVINEVLDLSKIEAGRETLELEAVAIGSLVRDTVAELGVRASGASVRLTASVPAELGELTTDQSKLKQVLINLVGNAIKFTPAEGRVEVRVLADEVSGAPTSIEIEDTGIGIPPERLGAIFDAFEQAEDHTSRRFGGTGLGLAISRRLCELMHHELTVESTVGKGSTFRVVLHDYRAAPEQAPQEGEGSSGAAA